MDYRVGTLLGSSDPDVVEEGLKALLEMDLNGRDVRGALPELVKLISSPSPTIRVLVVDCLEKWQHLLGDLGILIENALNKGRTSNMAVDRYISMRALIMMKGESNAIEPLSVDATVLLRRLGAQLVSPVEMSASCLRRLLQDYEMVVFLPTLSHALRPEVLSALDAVKLQLVIVGLHRFLSCTDVCRMIPNDRDALMRQAACFLLRQYTALGQRTVDAQVPDFQISEAESIIAADAGKLAGFCVECMQCLEENAIVTSAWVWISLKHVILDHPALTPKDSNSHVAQSPGSHVAQSPGSPFCVETEVGTSFVSYPLQGGVASSWSGAENSGDGPDAMQAVHSATDPPEEVILRALDRVELFTQSQTVKRQCHILSKAFQRKGNPLGKLQQRARALLTLMRCPDKSVAESLELLAQVEALFMEAAEHVAEKLTHVCVEGTAEKGSAGEFLLWESELQSCVREVCMASSRFQESDGYCETLTRLLRQRKDLSTLARAKIGWDRQDGVWSDSFSLIRKKKSFLFNLFLANNIISPEMIPQPSNCRDSFVHLNILAGIILNLAVEESQCPTQTSTNHYNIQGPTDSFAKINLSHLLGVDLDTFKYPCEAANQTMRSIKSVPLETLVGQIRQVWPKTDKPTAVHKQSFQDMVLPYDSYPIISAADLCAQDVSSVPAPGHITRTSTQDCLTGGIHSSAVGTKHSTESMQKELANFLFGTSEVEDTPTTTGQVRGCVIKVAKKRIETQKTDLPHS